nr:hypothetical protein [Tanacetum cinerariifolium]
MAENSLERGIPKTWVYPSYWLETWEDMYRPSKKRMKSDVVLCDELVKEGKLSRPSKKRMKSDVVLCDELVKEGKLSRSGKTITCLKCGEKSHNSRSCKGKRGFESTTRPMHSQGGS